MRMRRMGRTGLQVSEVCLGTMTFGNQCDRATSFRIMDIADAGGVDFFDTADVYPLGGDADTRGATEEIVGQWLHERRARQRIVLATKCRGAMGARPNEQGLSRKHVIAACEASLRRLRTDYIDLYQVHAPDPNTPIAETLGALDDLVRAGKVRYIGCSNYPAWQLALALGASARLGLERFDCAQPRYNLLFRMVEDEILPLCRAEGVGVIAYNPLAGGMLTGRYRGAGEPQAGTRFTLRHSGEVYRKRYWNEAVLGAVDHLAQYFDGRGKALTHVALAWVLAQPGITSAIVGASRPEQLEDSLRALDLDLTAEERAVCDDVWFNLPRERDPGIARR